MSRAAQQPVVLDVDGSVGPLDDELRLPLTQMDEPYRSRLKQALLDARLLS